MRCFKHTLVASLLLLLTACSIFRPDVDNTPDPRPLTAVQEQVQLSTAWSVRASLGGDEHYNQFQAALLEDALFTADSKGRVTRIAAQTGDRVWRVETNTQLSAGVGAGEDTVYVASADGQVIAIRAEDGSERWRINIGSEVLAPPQAANNIVVVHTGDSDVYALDVTDGRVLWTYEASSVPALILRGSSQPVIEDGVVYLGLANGRVVALSLNTGQLRWESVISVPSGRSELERLVDIIGPVIKEGPILYVASYQGNITALDSATGNPLWQNDISTYHALATDNNAVYAVDETGVVYAYNKLTGNNLWRNEALQYRRLSAPIVFDSVVVVGDFEGYLHLLSPVTGQLIGRHRLRNDPIMAQPIVSGDTLYVLNVKGELAALYQS